MSIPAVGRNGSWWSKYRRIVVPQYRIAKQMTQRIPTRGGGGACWASTMLEINLAARDMLTRRQRAWRPRAARKARPMTP